MWSFTGSLEYLHVLLVSNAETHDVHEKNNHEARCVVQQLTRYAGIEISQKGSTFKRGIQRHIQAENY